MSERKLPISVIVLTYNEALNLGKCLSSVMPYTDEIIVVDSGSTDNTLEVALKFNSKIFSNKFETHNKQWLWALENINLNNDKFIQDYEDFYVILINELFLDWLFNNFHYYCNNIDFD